MSTELKFDPTNIYWNRGEEMSEFIECDTCMTNKAWSPALCEGCQSNRRVIAELKERLRLLDGAQKLTLKSGDIIVVQSKQLLSQKMVEALKRSWDEMNLGVKIILLANGLELAPSYDVAQLQYDIAAAIAHRACCGTEHDPKNGKLHGCCVVCGVHWPCETAEKFLRPKD